MFRAILSFFFGSKKQEKGPVYDWDSVKVPMGIPEFENCRYEPAPLPEHNPFPGRRPDRCPDYQKKSGRWVRR
jgi:hypothetical protein